MDQSDHMAEPHYEDQVTLVARFIVSKDTAEEIKGQIEDFARDFLSEDEAKLESVIEEPIV